MRTGVALNYYPIAVEAVYSIALSPVERTERFSRKDRNRDRRGSKKEKGFSRNVKSNKENNKPRKETDERTIDLTA